MSYINGIGSSQQLSNTTDVLAASNTSKTARMDTVDSSVGSLVGFGGGVDGASMSATASAMAQALSGNDVRMDKVASLQQSIAAGTYSVPSSDVAGRVLNTLLN